jgi:hypothetical protein
VVFMIGSVDAQFCANAADDPNSPNENVTEPAITPARTMPACSLRKRVLTSICAPRRLGRPISLLQFLTKPRPLFNREFLGCIVSSLHGHRAASATCVLDQISGESSQHHVQPVPTPWASHPNFIGQIRPNLPGPSCQDDDLHSACRRAASARRLVLQPEDR